jgi:hypothetical protein
MSSRFDNIQSRSIYVGASPNPDPALGNLIIDGSAGIGTTSPAAKFQVSGGDGIINNAFIGEVPTYTSANAQFSHTSRAIAGEYSFLSANDGETFINSKTGYNIRFRVNNNDKVIINSAGNVGIGTTNPGAKLQINYTSGNAGLVVTGPVGDTWFPYNNGINYIRGELIVGDIASTNVQLVTGGGNVGIGTTSPGYKLQVNGDTAFFSTSGSPLSIITQGSEGKGRLYLYDGGSATIGLQTNGASYFNGGNVGIGTTSPNRTLTVNGLVGVTNGTANTQQFIFSIDGNAAYLSSSYIGSSSYVPMAFETGGAERMRITSGGNVGIGTTAPSGKLETYGGNVIFRNDVNGGTNTVYIRNWGSSANASLVFGTLNSDDSSTSLTHTSSNTFDITNYGDPGSSIRLGTRSSGGTSDIRLTVKESGYIQFNSYGSGSFTGTPTYNLAVDANGNIIETAGGVVDGSGTANYVTKWIDANTIGNSQIFDNGTRVGIGTSSPTLGKLQVEGDGIVINTEGTAAAKYLYFRYSNGGDLRSDSFLTFSTGGSPSEKMRISSDGNVGIGTTNPQSFVEINKNFSAGSTQKSYLQLTASQPGAWWSNVGVQFRWNDYGNGVGWKLGSVEGIVDGWSNPNGGGALAFYTKNYDSYSNDPTEKMRITAAGNIGIGTTSPSQKLDVAGKIRLTDDLFLDSTNPTITWGVGTLRFYSNAAAEVRAIIDASGNVGIGTSSPGYKLDVSGNARANSVIIGTDVTYGDPYRTVAFGNTGDGNNRILASTNTADGMYFMAATGQGFNFRPNGGTANLVEISSSGSLGIGTDNPLNKLEIKNGGGSTSYTGNDLVFYNANGQSAFYHDSGGYVYWYTPQDITLYPGTSRSVTFKANGNVGINTTIPQARLDVNGDLSIGDGSNGNQNIQIRYGNFSSGYGAVRFYQSGSNLSTIHSFSSAWQGSNIFNASSGAINITGNTGVTFGNWNDIDAAILTGGAAYFKNNVGIGTTNPYEKLDIDGNIRLGNFTTPGTRYIGYGNNTFANQFIAGMSIESTTVGGNYSQRLNFVTHNYAVDAAVRMTITESGNVGIGTTSISNAISGTERVLKISNPNIASLYFENNAGGFANYLNTARSLVWYDLTANTERMRITSAGNVGIGTTSPGAKLHVVGNTYIESGNLFVDTIAGYTTNVVSIAANTNFYVPSGNVGIGTTTPEQKLQVAGRAIVDQFQYTKAIYHSGDLNSLLTAGFYDGVNMLNAPNSGWFYVTVETHHGGNDWVHQTATSFGAGNTANEVYTRVRAGGVWTAWKELSDNGDISGTTNYISKFTSANSIGNSLLYDNGINVGVGTTAPDTSSIMDLSSRRQGFLPPRMTNSEMTSIGSPATGLIVYDTTNNKVTVYNGSSWVPLH